LANAVFLGFDAGKASAMNISWLEDFLTLAASGNFSRAADDRHMTQPAFSRRRGIAWLPATLVGDDIAAGRLAVAAADDWRIRLEVRLYREKANVGAAAERFWEAVSADAEHRAE
jgi:DNA-binding transcriptional LysR family regulator